MIAVNDDLFLKYQGGVQQNALLHAIQTYNDTHNTLNTLHISSYYDRDTFELLAAKNTSNVSIFSSNIQSINAKFNELEAYVLELDKIKFNFTMICLQESWLKDNDDVSQIQLENYYCITQGRHCSAKGGLLTYVHQTQHFTVINNEHEYNSWEYQIVKLTNDGETTDIMVINIYRPPNDIQQNYRQFIDEFSILLSAFEKCNSEIIITEDFNINLLKINVRPIFSEFYDILTTNSFLPKITLPTRFTETSGTLIDNFFCKVTTITIEALAGILTHKFSDHQPYFILLNTIKQKPPSHKFIKIRTQNERSLSNLKNEIETMNLYDKLNKNLFADPTENYNLLSTKLSEAKQLHIPDKIVKYRKHKHKKSTWITIGILKSIKYRDNLFMKLKHTEPNSANYLNLKINLKTYNNILKNSIRKAKQMYFTILFNKCKNDIKKTWNTIKSVLGHPVNTVSKSISIRVEDEEEPIPNNIEIANKFNTFFTEIGPTLANTITVADGANHNQYLTARTNTIFQFQPIHENDILNIINSFTAKTSCGYDDLSIRHIKTVKNEIAAPLTLITNQIINTGIFPDNLKIAKVVPIHTKADETDLNYYRPISLLPAVSKIIEKVIYNQVYNYFENHNIFYDHQYGFRKQHSTEHAVLEL